MGMILDDKQQGIHCEKRGESIVLYTDNGEESVEMYFCQAQEAVSLLQEALAMVDKTNVRSLPMLGDAASIERSAGELAKHLNDIIDDWRNSSRLHPNQERMLLSLKSVINKWMRADKKEAVSA